MLAAGTNAPGWPFPDTKIDKLRNRSYAGLMNLQVPPELEAKLTRLAAETGRTADQVALDLLASSMDHDECSARRSKKAVSLPVKAGCWSQRSGRRCSCGS